MWDEVIGAGNREKLKEQIFAFKKVNQEVVSIDRCWDGIEEQANDLMARFKEKDPGVLRDMLMNLKVFLINYDQQQADKQMCFCPAWLIVSYVLVKNFDQVDAYTYFVHLVLGVFPGQYFEGAKRDWAAHAYNRFFGMLAANYASDLQKVLSVSLSVKTVQPGSAAQQKISSDEKAVDEVGVLQEKKDTVRNREPFIQLMEKVAEIYLGHMFLDVVEPSCVLRLIDVLFCQGFDVLIKTGLKILAKVQPKVLKKVKADIADLTKRKVALDVTALRRVAEQSYALFQVPLTTTEFNLALKGSLEDKKMGTFIGEKRGPFMQVALAEQVKNECQFDFNKRVFALQHARQVAMQLQGPQDAATSNLVMEGLLKM